MNPFSQAFHYPIMRKNGHIEDPAYGPLPGLRFTCGGGRHRVCFGYRLVDRREESSAGRVKTPEATMLGSVSFRHLGFLLALGLVCSASLSAQQAGRGQQAQQGGAEGPRASNALPVFKIDWVRPTSQTGQVPAVQENIADANIELKEYGPAAKEFLTSGTPGSENTPFTVWSGACTGPFAITFRQKNNYVDLTGLGRIRWTVKTSGFHEVRPVVKLADGTLLVGDHTDASVAMFSVREFPLADVRWMKLDPNRVVTLGVQGPANQIWVNNPDLSKVDEVGFVDLMPGSGHGVGGYIHLGTIEVYGKAVPRATTTSSR